MGRKRRPRHLSPRARAARRERAEAERRERIACAEEFRAARAALEILPIVCRRHDPDWIVEQAKFRYANLKAGRLRALVWTVARRRPELLDEPYLYGLYHLTTGSWLRPPDTWCPTCRSSARAMDSLIDHLVGRYPVSRSFRNILLERTWNLSRMKLNMTIFAHVAQGGSLHDLAGSMTLPTPLTRRMCHLVTNPDRPGDLAEVIRRSQVLALGGTAKLADQVADEIDWPGYNEMYWARAIHWFCRQPPQRDEDFAEIVDYLESRLDDYEPVDLRGRTFVSLRRERKRHIESMRLACEQETGDSNEEARHREAIRAKRRLAIDPFDRDGWTIEEIRTRSKLAIEGAAMKHCVAGYWCQVADGRCSIWSLRRAGKRILTLSVRHEDRIVDEMAGKCDRHPRPQDLRIVKAWARANGLETHTCYDD